MRGKYLAICAVLKDEGRYLEEWLRFYLHQGVGYFILYDNGSSDNPERVVRRVLSEERYRLLRVEQPRYQLQAYRHCIESFKERFRWIGFLDLDEFCFSTEGDDLPAFLSTYEKAPALAVHRLDFGTSGHKEPTDDLVTRAYTQRGRINLETSMDRWRDTEDRTFNTGGKLRFASFIKSFVDPREVRQILSAHHFGFQDGRIAVNEFGRPVKNMTSQPITVSRIRVNHYFTKSQQELEARLQRTIATGEPRYDPDWLMEYAQHLNEREDWAIQPLVTRCFGPSAASPVAGIAKGNPSGHDVAQSA